MAKLIILSLIFLISCSQGLDPAESEKVENGIGYFAGTVKIKGGADAWPQDSSFGLRVVAFKSAPPFEIDSLVNSIIDGKAYFTFESMPLFADSAKFIIPVSDAPITLEYIAVALQTDSTDLLSQMAVGVYSESGDFENPSSLPVNSGDTARITIEVDFQNIPPSPFK